MLIVLRPASDLPPGWMPPSWDGRWVEADRLLPRLYDLADDEFVAAAWPTGRYEIREDGARAEVYEVRAQRRDV